MRRIFSIGLLLFGLLTSLQGQEVQAILSFDSDTMAIGMPVSLKLAIQHPQDVMVEFPTPRDFEPFEWVGSEPEPTQTLEGISWDVVTYQVRSFSLEEAQALFVPYAYYSGQDTFRAYAFSDTIRLNLRLTEWDPSMQYNLQTGLLELQDPPNYLLWISIILGVAALLLVIGYFLRHPVQRYLAYQKNQTEWQVVRRRLRKLEDEADQVYLFKELSQLWKGYLDPRDRRGFRFMTTTELRNHLERDPGFSQGQRGVLIRASQQGDQVIYAGKSLERPEIKHLIGELKQVLGHIYQIRKKALGRKK
ncbi:MAG: hypothetical protein AAFR61_16120 [Bacteroidota bacterium]